MELIRKAISGVSRYALAKVFDRLRRSQEDPFLAQERTFLRLKGSLRGTRIHADLGLDRCGSYEQYVKQTAVRPFSYYEPYVDEVMDGKADVLFRGRPRVFLKTSGTTGKMKYVPYGADAIKAFVNFQTQIMSSVVHNDPSFFILNKRISLGNTCAEAPIRGVPVDFVSGLVRTCAPFILKSTMYPTPRTLAQTNWRDKVDSILVETSGRDIRAASGLPVLLASLFQDALGISNKTHIQDLWPNLRTLVYSGGPIDAYRPLIDGLSREKLTYVGAFMATECPMGFEIETSRGSGSSLVLDLDNVLFSFTDPDRPEANLHVGELGADREYVVNIGFSNGFLQYPMNDVVRVTSVKPRLEIEVRGRSNVVMNAACEKVSDSQLNQAIHGFETRLGTRVRHVFVYPERGPTGRFNYTWLVFSDDRRLSGNPELPTIMDEEMRKRSIFYSTVRGQGIIADTRLKVLPADLLKGYLDENNHVGNFKPRRAFLSAGEFTEFFERSFHRAYTP